MKFITSILLTALLSFVMGLYLPWWSIALAAFIVGLIVPQSAGKAWLSGFIGLFLLWGGLASWIDHINNGLLLDRIAVLFKLQGKVVVLMLLTAIIGGLVASFAAMAGSYARQKNVDE